MSGSDCDGGEICRVDGSQGGDDKAIVDDDDAGGPCKSDDNDQKQQRRLKKKKKKKNRRLDFETRNLGAGTGIGCCFRRNLAKAKQAVVTKTKAEGRESRPSSSSSSSSSSPGKGIDFKHCCFGFNNPRPRPPPILASQLPISTTASASDPNGPNFTSDRLRILIQRNDFYCRECNPHSASLFD